jgi:hypothetical protein
MMSPIATLLIPSAGILVLLLTVWAHSRGWYEGWYS